MAENNENLGMIMHEGPLRVRQGNKWKSRWCVLSLSSPVSDKLRFTFKKEIKRQGDRKSEYREKFSFECIDYCGMITELRIDSCQHAMCIVFAKKMLTLGFESKYSQTDWECRIRSVYGEENLFTFAVEIPRSSPNFLSRIRSGNTSAMMFIFNDNIAFVTLPDDDVPQKLASMKLSSVACYGADQQSRTIMLKLKKKAYRFESNTPDAILKALDHVSGRRLLHESEAPDEIRLDMGPNQYGHCLPSSDTRLSGLLPSSFDNSSPFVSSSASASGGNNTNPSVGCHSNDAYRLLGTDTSDGSGVQIQSASSQLLNQQHYQRPFSSSSPLASMFGLNDSRQNSANISNTLSSNNSTGNFAPQNSIPHRAFSPGVAAPGYSVTHAQATQGKNMSNLYLSDVPHNMANFGQPSPSSSYASSYMQHGSFDDRGSGGGDKQSSTGGGGGANYFQQHQMSAFYEQDTSLQISVNLPPASTATPDTPTYPQHFKSPDQSFHSSQVSQSGYSSAGTHTNSVFSSPREQEPLEATSADLFNSNLYSDLFHPTPPPRVPPSAPTRKPPVPPKRTSATLPSNLPEGFSSVQAKTQEQLFDSRPQAASLPLRYLRTSDFFCEHCGLRRWISCPDISLGCFSKTDFPQLQSQSRSRSSRRQQPCTAKKCRNQSIAKELSRGDLLHKYLTRVAWVRDKTGSSQLDLSAFFVASNRMRLAKESACRGRVVGGTNKVSQVSSSYSNSAATATTKMNMPTSTSATTGSQHVYGAYSGSGSIELDGVSIVVSSHDSTPLYDDIVCNAPPPPLPNSIHPPPRPGTAPNLLNNGNSTSAANMWKSSQHPFQIGAGNAQQTKNPPGSARGHSKTPPPSASNPLNLQFKHQTTMDPQGNLRGHLYINLDYPTQTTCGDSAPSTATQNATYATDPQSNCSWNHAHNKFTSPVFSTNVAPAGSGSRHSHAGSAVSVGGVDKEQFWMRGSNVNQAGGLYNGMKGTGSVMNTGNYSHLNNVRSVFPPPGVVTAATVNDVPKRDDAVTKRKSNRTKKPATCDLYQNLNLNPPLTSATGSNSSASPSTDISAASASSATPAIPSRPKRLPEDFNLDNHNRCGSQLERRSDLMVATNACNTDLNNDKQLRNNRLQQAVANRQCVNRWIDNAVELSNYSRDNSPDTFIASASISDSRDDVFLTDNELQGATSSLESRVKKQDSFNLSPPEPPPPRQKTHNYHNIDPFLNINHKHCPDNELGINLDLANIAGDHRGIPNAADLKQPPNLSSRKAVWQNITTPMRPPPKHDHQIASKITSPIKVASSKPPISSSRRNFNVISDQLNSAGAAKASENYRSLNFATGSADSISGAASDRGQRTPGDAKGKGQHPSGLSAKIDFRHKSSMAMGVHSKIYDQAQAHNSGSSKGRQPGFNSHNVSATGRSRSESRTAATNSLGGFQVATAKPNNQVVNYSMMDESWAKTGDIPVTSQKPAQVSKAEKALVQYSLVDGQLTKALHDAGKQHTTNRINFNSTRRKSSGKSSLAERQSSLSGVGGAITAQNKGVNR